MRDTDNARRRDLLAELEREADAGYPESWRPKPGDSLAGVLLRYTKGDSPYGERHIAIVRVEPTSTHGEYLAAVWLSHTALLREFREHRPRPGERLAIRRLEDRTKTDARGRETTYAMYRVLVDRPAERATPDWDAMAESSQPDGQGGAV